MVLHEESRIAIYKELDASLTDGETATVAIARLTRATGLARSGVMFAFGRARPETADAQFEHLGVRPRPSEHHGGPVQCHSVESAGHSVVERGERDGFGAVGNLHD